jgi:rSAM/selenodomain-associated transferase 2
MSDNAAIAVLVPTLNEAERIGALLTVLDTMGFSEIVLADGGSADDTVAIARSFPTVRCVETERGRGKQLRAAMAASSAPIVFFLHADTVPPRYAVASIRQALQSPDVVAGCFRLRFDERSLLLDLSAWCTRFETPLTTFGDQGFFVKRSTLQMLGGVPDQLFLEDVELRARLVRAGSFVKLSEYVLTSSRRYKSRGVFVGQLRNALIVAGYYAGLSPETLSRFYPPQKPSV